VEALDINLFNMFFLILFLLIPVGIFHYFKINLVKKTWVNAVRMSIQLILVGMYLGWLFKFNSLVINIIWLLVMMMVATRHILKNSKLKVKTLFLPVFSSLLIAMTLILVPIILGIVQPDPWWDARYLVPIGGMLLGNFLNSNIVALSHFSSELSKRYGEVKTALCFGASRFEATKPLVKESLVRGLTPVLTTMGTLGLVSLPGMMTGQILGGSFPIVAIKYQIVIMIAIVSAASVALSLSLILVIFKLLRVNGELNH